MVYADPVPLYAIPATLLPALSARYGAPCEGLGKPVLMRGGGRGYRSVLCGELSNPPMIVTVGADGRLRWRPEPAA